MKNIERRRINLVKTSTGEKGCLWLAKLAVPETVKITVNGEKVVPAGFDIYGQPVLPKSSAKCSSLRKKHSEEKRTITTLN